MLKRIHVKGFKSLEDVEVKLGPLAVLIGVNAAGKSNFLDALQLLSRIGTGETLDDAFKSLGGGEPIEAFTMGEGGVRALVGKDALRFSMEADIEMSAEVVARTERQVREFQSDGADRVEEKGGPDPPIIRDRTLRYRIEVEMLPASGELRVADESLRAVNMDGRPKASRKPYIDSSGGMIQLRLEGRRRAEHFERRLNHSIVAGPHYPPHHPHVVALRNELKNWAVYSFEPSEKMRAAATLRAVHRLGPKGEELPAFYYTLRAVHPRQYEALELALHAFFPDMDGVVVDVNDVGRIELRVRERGVELPVEAISDGTIRLLGLLALDGGSEPPSLVGVEEPEAGMHASRIDLIAEVLKSRQRLGRGQYVVTTHSPILADHVPAESLFVVRRIGGRTAINAFTEWGPLYWTRDGQAPVMDPEESSFPVSERILRGDFDA